MKRHQDLLRVGNHLYKNVASRRNLLVEESGSHHSSSNTSSKDKLKRFIQEPEKSSVVSAAELVSNSLDHLVFNNHI
jgi:hypothetical protein